MRLMLMLASEQMKMIRAEIRQVGRDSRGGTVARQVGVRVGV